MVQMPTNNNVNRVTFNNINVFVCLNISIFLMNTNIPSSEKINTICVKIFIYTKNKLLWDKPMNLQFVSFSFRLR